MVIIKVKQFRMAKGLTQRQLSEKTEISKSQLGRIENGESFPTVDKAFDIAHALGASITDIFEYHFIENPQSG